MHAWWSICSHIIVLIYEGWEGRWRCGPAKVKERENMNKTPLIENTYFMGDHMKVGDVKREDPKERELSNVKTLMFLSRYEPGGHNLNFFSWKQKKLLHWYLFIFTFHSQALLRSFSDFISLWRSNVVISVINSLQTYQLNKMKVLSKLLGVWNLLYLLGRCITCYAFLYPKFTIAHVYNFFIFIKPEEK